MSERRRVHMKLLTGGQPLQTVFKVFGSQAFEPDSQYNRHNHFQTFMAGLLVLFR